MSERRLKVVLTLGVLFSILFPMDANAQTLDTDFSIEEGQRSEIRKRQGREDSGYVYDSLEAEKQLIFQQLEIITGDEETRYIIVPGDTMTVSYQDRAERSGAVYKVSSKGEIHLPLVGASDVATMLDGRFEFGPIGFETIGDIAHVKISKHENW